MKILKVTAYFHHVTPEGVRWDFHEGETLSPTELAQRGLGEADIEAWKTRGRLEETEADVVEASPSLFAHVEDLIASHHGLAGEAGDAAMLEQSGAGAPEEE